MNQTTLVVGAGPAGLAAAAELGRAGVSAVVLERAEAIGAAWRGRYDRLRLNTSRLTSKLPAARYRPGTSRFPTRDEFVRYLEDYASHHELDVRLGTASIGSTAIPTAGSARSSAGELAAAHVIVATGYERTPRTSPSRPGRDRYGDNCCTLPSTAAPNRSATGMCWSSDRAARASRSPTTLPSGARGACGSRSARRPTSCCVRRPGCPATCPRLRCSACRRRSPTRSSSSSDASLRATWGTTGSPAPRGRVRPAQARRQDTRDHRPRDARRDQGRARSRSTAPSTRSTPPAPTWPMGPGWSPTRSSLRPATAAASSRSSDTSPCSTTEACPASTPAIRRRLACTSSATSHAPRRSATWAARPGEQREPSHARRRPRSRDRARPSPHGSRVAVRVTAEQADGSSARAERGTRVFARRAQLLTRRQGRRAAGGRRGRAVRCRAGAARSG